MDSTTPPTDRRFGGSTLFDFTLLFRAMGVALWPPTRILLALVGVIASGLLGLALDAVWAEGSSPVEVRMDGHWVSEAALYQATPDASGVRAVIAQEIAVEHPTRIRGVFELVLEQLRLTEDRCIAGVFGLDFRELLRAGRELLTLIAWLISMHSVYAILFGLGLAAIWGFVGIGICRGVSLAIARNDEPTLAEYRDTCKARWGQAALIPLLPILVMLGAAIALWAFGLLGAIPMFGGLIVGVLFPIVIFGGLVIGFAMVLGVAAMPMAPYGIVAAGEDATDAVFNTVSFIVARPVKTFFYYLVAFVVGVIAFAAIKWLISLSLWCGGSVLGMTMNVGPASIDGAAADVARPGALDAVWTPPNPAGNSAFYGTFPQFELAGSSWASRGMIRLWLMFSWAVLAAFAVSYGFASAGIAWSLLRRDVDGTDITEVIAENADKESGTGSAVS